MITFKEGRLTFSFPKNSVAKYDETAFYKTFKQVQNGVKAVDFIYIDGQGWLIEVKDYRKITKKLQNEIKEFEPEDILPSELSNVITKKIFDTLEGINLAKEVPDADIYSLSQEFFQQENTKVVLHLEQDKSYEKFRAIDPADILQQLRRLLRSIDLNPYVVDCSNLPTKPEINWSVQSE
ncbi:MAG: hypothetical protein Q4A60_01360 [Pasteurellaceae bacterium]|nr:hypothetical protein [Pasteurellaceae bacterium]